MSLQKPVTGEFFVALFDLTNFGKFYRSNTSEVLFETILEFTQMAKSSVEGSGGRIIKFSNDSGVAIFPADDVDNAVMTFIKLRSKVDEWARKKVPGSQLAMNGHVGMATWGALADGNLEIVGEAVGTVYTMGKKQFVISPQAFRKLSANTRKTFNKFTLPIVYRLNMNNEI